MTPADRERGPYTTATISANPRDNIRRYITRVTGERSWGRWMWQGTLLTILSGMPTVFGSVIRSRVYRSILGGVGKGCFIEKGVRWQVPRRVFLGQRVMIGQECFFDANSLDSRIEIKDDVWLSQGCYLIAGRGVEIIVEPSTYIGHRCLFYGHGGIRIGRDALLANDVQLICGNHTFARRDLPIRAQPSEERPIVIEDDVWLGASAIILGGVTVGKGSVVAAGAVVTHSLPPYSVARGVPAQIVGMRGAEPSSGEDAPVEKHG
jgi:acetyltransferase-like isoleucine patch superfamily enzyme